MHSYQSILDASHGLLGDVVSVLRNAGVGEFAVIGGWSPFLLNSGPHRHPGTKDADILFADGYEPGVLRPAVEALRDAGYLLSAKHEFQLLRHLAVRDTTFVFNVDLLHPGASEPNPALFADHVTLPIPLAEYREDMFTVKSIVVPNANFIFNGHVVSIDFMCTLPDGTRSQLDIPLMDEVGLIATKAQSVRNPKRPRDSYDVFLAVSQARDRDAVLNGFRALEETNLPVFNSLFGIKKALDDGILGQYALGFLEGAASWNDAQRADAVVNVNQTITRFLRAIPLPAKARLP